VNDAGYTTTLAAGPCEFINYLNVVVHDLCIPANSYSHGLLFPSEVTRVKKKFLEDLKTSTYAAWNATAATWAPWTRSTVSTFGVAYSPPVQGLSTQQSVEALVEGSEMSKLKESEGSFYTPSINIWLMCVQTAQYLSIMHGNIAKVGGGGTKARDWAERLWSILLKSTCGFWKRPWLSSRVKNSLNLKWNNNKLGCLLALFRFPVNTWDSITHHGRSQEHETHIPLHTNSFIFFPFVTGDTHIPSIHPGILFFDWPFSCFCFALFLSFV
jgi:hypothetical protein